MSDVLKTEFPERSSRLRVSEEGIAGQTAGTVYESLKTESSICSGGKGLTPSCTAATAPLSTYFNAFFTEWKRVIPPDAIIWGPMLYPACSQ